MAHNPTMPTETEMPRYRSIRSVHALTIKQIDPDTTQYGSYLLSFEEPDHPPVSVSGSWYRSFPMTPGDFYLVRDGRAIGVFSNEFRRDYIKDVPSQDLAMALVKIIQELEAQLLDSSAAFAGASVHTPQQILNAAAFGTPLS